MVAYAFAVVPLFHYFGAGIAILAVVPVGVVGRTFGFRAGAAAGIIAFPLNIVLFNLAQPGDGLAALTDVGSLADAVAVFAIGVLFGHTRDSDQRVKVELIERRRAEDALRESDARKAAILESSADCIIAVDAAGTILEFNSASERVFGYLREYAIGQRMVDLILPRRLRSLTWDSMRRLMAAPDGHGQGRQFETMALRSDGKEFAVEILLGFYRVGSQVVCSASIRDITERRKQAAALEYQAYHDHLTELPNRLLFVDRLQQAIHTAGREARLLALLMLDLDGFKAVNDSAGHHVGDELLQQVAKRLRGEVRASDTVARLGGDEFAIIVPEIADLAGLEALAGKIAAVLTPEFEVDGRSYGIRASIGIAIFPDHGRDVDTLVRHSDSAMYAAKRGRFASRIWIGEPKRSRGVATR
jgi:diguanylate cyclase (GGDEF)-like protein/PAS domain S-box-containing protein